MPNLIQHTRVVVVIVALPPNLDPFLCATLVLKHVHVAKAMQRAKGFVLERALVLLTIITSHNTHQYT